MYQLAEFGIFIGERDCWVKGYGTETTTLMLDYGFTLLGLHNIMLCDVGRYGDQPFDAFYRSTFLWVFDNDAWHCAAGHTSATERLEPLTVASATV